MAHQWLRTAPAQRKLIDRIDHLEADNQILREACDEAHKFFMETLQSDCNALVPEGLAVLLLKALKEGEDG